MLVRDLDPGGAQPLAPPVVLIGIGGEQADVTRAGRAMIGDRAPAPVELLAVEEQQDPGPNAKRQPAGPARDWAQAERLDVQGAHRLGLLRPVIDAGLEHAREPRRCLAHERAGPPGGIETSIRSRRRSPPAERARRTARRSTGPGGGDIVGPNRCARRPAA